MHLHFCFYGAAAPLLSYLKALGGRMVAAAALMAPNKVVAELMHVSFAMFHIKKMQLITK
jgi:hypothetical protein